MAESRPTPSSPSPDDMHWGISYLREDLQDVKQELRDFRKEVNERFSELRREVNEQIAELRREVNEQIAELRGEVNEQIADLRRELHRGLRHNLLTMIAIGGVYTGIIIAFIEYRLGTG